ncbi:MAG: YicC family protein [Verrucomicrobia bacterium]|nr:YicC family protein [Verrucomicrobiota bacterium]
MTGHGRGECARNGFKVTVEVSSVNRKQSEISVNLPRELESLEPLVRDEINRWVSRGRITAKISLHLGESGYRGRALINSGLAKAYAKEIRKLAQELRLDNAVTLDLVLRAPGVLQVEDPLWETETFWPAIAKALVQALKGLLAMRQREGSHLAEDLSARVAAMRESVARIGKTAPLMVERYREQLRNRIKNAGLEIPALDDERLSKEIAYFADRSDISEELSRLESHFKQFQVCLKSKEPIGRTLDFLAQEMNREINTLGSKAADSAVSREVVTLKAALEKFREQVQNVE